MTSKLKDLPRFFQSKQKQVQVVEKKEAREGDVDSVESQPHLHESGSDEKNSGVQEEDPYFTVQSNAPVPGQDHTLVRSPNKKIVPMKGSLVGLREGVPGSYSGFDRVPKKEKHKTDGSDKKRLRSKSSPIKEVEGSKDALSPIRPPRRNRQKSGSDRSMSDRSMSEGEYDVLWQHAKDEQRRKLTRNPHGSTYSMLLPELEPSYDMVDPDEATVLVEAADTKDGDWVETGVRMYDNGARASPIRPQSTVVLPLLAGDDVESDSDSWATDFDACESEEEDVDDSTIYEVIGEQSGAPTRAPMPKNDYDDLGAIRKKMGYLDDNVPPLPPRSTSELSLSDIEDPDKMTYVPVNFSNPPPILPPLTTDASDVEIKRYQIIKCLLEHERHYTMTLHRIFQEYEQPLKEKRIISKDRVKVIFHFIHEIEQCHQLFNMALAGRMAEWVTNPNVGDIIYASFSKSTVLKAYSNFARNFTRAMDSVKETCKLVPAFLYFLKNRLYRSHRKQTLYDLLKRPLERLPQLIVLVQELLLITPFPHQDHMSLQMALTELECLSETVIEKRRDVGTRHKVKQLDKYLTGLNKGLSSKKRYYVRHDDMLLCKCTNGQVTTTKLRRLFMLSDLLICAKVLNKTKQLATLGNKRYKVKWCVPLVDVEIIDVGTGISVNVDNKTTTTIKYTHPLSASPRPGVKAVQEKIEDLQHDLTIIGHIAGLVASLRGNHDVLNPDKVNEWYRQVRETCDYETEMANMNWLEISLPAKDGKTSCLFNLSTARRKLEWTAELDNTKLRLSYKNNPGWYLPDEEGISSGGTAVLRRTLPLLSCSVPLFMVEQKYTIECILEVTHPHPAKPILWIFSGNDHAGQITLMEMSMSSVPHVVESFGACNSRISTAEVVRERKGHFNDPHQEDISIWTGTVAGYVEVFDGSVNGEHKKIATARLKDSVVCLRQVNFRIFAGLADGTVACFRKKVDNSWDFKNPTIVMLGQHAILALAVALNRLWCSCGNSVMVLDVDTLGIENVIKINDESKPGIKHLISYGVGVWVSTWKSAKLELYHAETYECLQTINVAMPVGRMKNVIDSDVQNIATEKLYITSILAHDGILWVGTDVGIILTYPLPRLGGVPQVSGRPCVSFHGHNGPVRCLRSFRVTRNLKQRQFDNGSTVAKSLFYSNAYDDVDAKETDLDAIRVIPKDANQRKMSPDATSISGEPFYFTVVADQCGGQPREPDRNDEYNRWVSSFGNLPNPLDPTKQVNGVKGNDEIGYHSDESIDSETEFCFIEDRKTASVKGQTRKTDTYLSVNIQEQLNGNKSVMPNVVTTKSAVSGLPVVLENEFVETISQFSGFEGSPPRTKDSEGPVSSTPENEVDINTKGKTFPLSSNALKEEEDETPRLYRVCKSNDLLYEQPVDDYVDVNEELKAKTFPMSSNDKQESVTGEILNSSRHYKYAPLPPVPSDGTEPDGLKCENETVDEENVYDVYDATPKDGAMDAPGESHGTSSVIMDEVRSDIVILENSEDLAVEETVGSPSLDLKGCSDEQLAFTVATGGTLSLPVPDVIEDVSEVANINEEDKLTDVDGISFSKSKKGKKDRDTSKLALDISPIPQAPSNVEESEEGSLEVYTPLLPDKQSVKQMNVSNVSSLAGTGLEEYERETALSASLVRNSPEGYYATLVAASRDDDRTKRELLLQPWYIVTVGPGHVDFRKKPTRASAKDFFKSLRNSDPEPQLLIWKITSG